jgi:hypothetical protein
MSSPPKQRARAFLLLGALLLEAPLLRGRFTVVPAVLVAAYVVEPRRLASSSLPSRQEEEQGCHIRSDGFGWSRASIRRRLPAVAPSPVGNQPLAKGRIRGESLIASATAGREDSSSLPDASEPTATETKPKAPRRVNYVRPSAAIERGSGFFVPGLEGGKARLAMGTVLVALCIVQQHQLADLGLATRADGALAIASLYSGLVLLQSGIEFAQDSVRQERSRRAVSTDKVESGCADLFACSWARSDDADVRDAAAGSAARLNVNEYKDRVEWAASTYLSLTPATRMLLVHNNKVVFESQMLAQTMTPLPTRDESVDAIPKGSASTTALLKGRTNPEIIAEDVACRAALATLEQSATGRVALPPSHPAFRFVVSGTDPAVPTAGGSQRRTRTVILQRISSHSCWAVASSDLLAAFTPQDLTWLGQLARYLPS